MSADDPRFTVLNISCPFTVMRFHLIYQGPLSASANSSKPHEARDIRDKLHPQLELLWKTHAALRHLCEPLTQDGNLFIPVVRKSLNLTCSLSILFLRKEELGALVLQGGDIDGRLKTLFDALQIPDIENLRNHPQEAHSPICCLLENDSLITGVEVSTGRLLFPTDSKPNEVCLVIEVEVRVMRLGDWNISLMGG